MAATPKEHKTPTSARTVGMKVARTSDGQFVIVDVRKDWWSPHEVDEAVLQAARLDGPNIPIREEEEGGSSGKTVIAHRRKLLAGYNYRGLAKRQDKITSATAARSQVEGGNVAILVPISPNGEPELLAQKMATEFLNEIELFPVGTLKDQVDAFTQAVNVLTGVAEEPLDILTGTEPSSAAEQEAEVRAYLREQGLDPDKLYAEDVDGIEDLLS